MDHSLKYSTITEGEICTYTEPFRGDLDWVNFARLLDRNFIAYPNVNFHCLACSDLSEAYTSLIVVDRFSSYPNKIKKIKCYDKDSVILEAAAKRRINFTEDDIRRIEKIAGYNQEYFIDKKTRIPIFAETTEPMSSYAVSKSLCDRTEIIQCDLLEVLKNIIDEGNTVVACRNVFPYLSEDYQEEFAKTLVEKLKPNSLYLRGAFDVRTHFSEILEELSSKSNPNRCFEKMMTHVYRRI